MQDHDPLLQPRQPKPSNGRRGMRTAGGILAALAVAATKIKVALAGLFALKWLFLGSKLLLSFGSIFLSLGFYALLFGGWKIAIVFVLMILVHELGHLLTFRNFGIPASLPVFIPGLGAFVSSPMSADPAKNAIAALMGPVFGVLAAAACWAYGLATHEQFWIACAYIGFFLNVFNLLPVFPFDGGRVAGAIDGRALADRHRPAAGVRGVLSRIQHLHDGDPHLRAGELDPADHGDAARSDRHDDPHRRRFESRRARAVLLRVDRARRRRRRGHGAARLRGPLYVSLRSRTAAIALALALTVLRPPPTQGPFGRDFEAYDAAGATWNAGGDPWSRDVWRTERTIGGVDSSRDELLPYAGPAALLPLFGAFARLPYRDRGGRLDDAAARSVRGARPRGVRARRPRAARRGDRRVRPHAGERAGDERRRAGADRGRLGGGDRRSRSLAYERAAGARDGRVATLATVGGAAATLLAAAQPNLALPLLARLRDRRAIAGVAAAVTAFGALTLAGGGGIDGVRAYAGVLRAHGAAERFDAIQHTPAAIAYAFGASPEAALAAGALCALAAIAVTIVAIVRLRLGARDGTLAALAALPLAAPFFHEHDLVIALLPLLLLATRARAAARAWAGAAAALVLVDWFGLAQRPGAQAQILIAGFACAALFAALRSERMGRADVAPFAVLALGACIALPLARSAPAPVWPDALPAGYRAPANASASDVWRDEQHVAGLDRRVPAWGMLRALPLAGCACLFVAVTLHGRRPLKTNLHRSRRRSAAKRGPRRVRGTRTHDRSAARTAKGSALVKSAEPSRSCRRS